MISIYKAYKVFASKPYRIVMNILCAFNACLTALVLFASRGDMANPLIMNEKLGILREDIILAVVVVSSIFAIFVTFADYFIFAGIAARHTGTMAVLRSSLKGEELLDKGLLGDFIFNLIRTFLSGPAIGVIATIIYGGKGALGIIGIIIALWAGMIITTGGANLLTRRFAKTIAGMVVFTYVGIAFWGAIVTAICALVINVNLGIVAPWVVAIFVVIAIALAITLFAIGRREALKGYKSGFEDKL